MDSEGAFRSGLGSELAGGTYDGCGWKEMMSKSVSVEIVLSGGGVPAESAAKFVTEESAAVLEQLVLLQIPRRLTPAIETSSNIKGTMRDRARLCLALFGGASYSVVGTCTV